MVEQVKQQWGTLDILVANARPELARFSSATAVVSVHPGGTTDIQRVRMACRISVGRSGREAAGTVHRARARAGRRTRNYGTRHPLPVRTRGHGDASLEDQNAVLVENLRVAFRR